MDVATLCGLWCVDILCVSKEEGGGKGAFQSAVRGLFVRAIFPIVIHIPMAGVFS